MNNRYNTTSSDTYSPEKPNHVRTAVHAFFYIIVYHIATYLLYAILMSPLENQMVGDGYEPRYRFVMFALVHEEVNIDYLKYTVYKSEKA